MKKGLVNVFMTNPTLWDARGAAKGADPGCAGVATVLMLGPLDWPQPNKIVLSTVQENSRNSFIVGLLQRDG
jgi:hypothetical protein